MKLQNLISALSNATETNPLGQESLLPYWNFFWTAQEKETLSAHERIRIFLLHIYFHYFNDKAENSAIFMTSDWPDWMIATARRHTRASIQLHRVSDNRAATALIAENALENIGWFTDVGAWEGGRMKAADTARPLLHQWPRNMAHLLIFPCPVLGEFGDRIQIAPQEAKGTFALPHLWAIAPYGIMIGLVE